MAKVNENYAKLPGSYLFAEIARRTAEYSAAHPDANLIKMGIGDVTRPLAPAVIDAMHAAVNDMASIEAFHGYGPEQGYDFLRKAIADNDFRSRGVEVDEDEIFVSDGAKSDCGNIGDILSSSLCAIPCILCMLIPMPWLVAPANMMRNLKVGQILFTCPPLPRTILFPSFLKKWLT